MSEGLDVGDEVVVDVGPVAHGGHCVARHEGQVLFVRHTIPGERVTARVTERQRSFVRADAVEVHTASPARVTPPCPYARPGLCGGCDFQHVDPAEQRRMLGDVVSEQLRRLAGLDREVVVEEVEPVLGWRTRMTFVPGPTGHLGLRKHRSHEVVEVERCWIAHPGLPDVLAHDDWESPSVEAVVSSTGDTLVVADGPVPDGLETGGVVSLNGRRREGRGGVTEEVGPHRFRVTGSGFWQVHPESARTLTDAVMEAGDVRPGDAVADLYAGVGLFTAPLAEATGPSGSVVSVEADHGGTRDARRNLHGFEHVRLVDATVEAALRRRLVGERLDVVVLDPPRTGAKKAVAGIVALEPRTIVYVACDPAALARDLASFAARGYELDGLRAFDLFPQTHHVECVAVLRRTASAPD
nr:TRAM domain-containing protein [Aeromicrobium massiliense]